MRERELEDYIVANLHGDIFADYAPDHLTLIARQLVLPHGILDLLLFNGCEFWVTELKAVPIRAQDYTQVMRYTEDIKKILLDLDIQRVTQIYRMKENRIPHSISSQAFDESLEVYLDRDSVIPVLIGPVCSDNVRFVMQCVNGMVFTFNQKTNPIRFTRQRSDSYYAHASEDAIDTIWQTVTERAFTNATEELDEIANTLFNINTR